MGRHSTINKGRMWRWNRGGGGETTRRGNNGGDGNNDDANGDSGNATLMMAAVTAVVAAAMAMTMGCDGNGGDVDNGSDSSGGNAGDDDDGNDDGNGIYHVYLHLKKWMSILNIILDQYKASLKT